MKGFIFGLGIVFSGLVMGCTEPPMVSMSISLVTKPPLPVEVSSTKIVTPEGIGSGVKIVCKDAEGDRLDSSPGITWDSAVEMVEVPGASLTQTDQEDVYILESSKVGLYKVTMFSRGALPNESLSFGLEVTEQPPLEP